MDTNGVRKRSGSKTQEKLNLGAGASVEQPNEPHPAGEIKHGTLLQIIRALGAIDWFFGNAVAIHITQWLGTPMYFWSKDHYYAWMALTKQSFAICLMAVVRVFCPTTLWVSWDESMRGQLYKTDTGLLESSFPERIVLMSNHQIYTDWLYLWWIAYTSRMHGHIYIILKESLKYIPFLGPGMMFYGFIFMARKWASDKPRLQHRLNQLKGKHRGPLSGKGDLDPMWLLIFPEGTNLSANTRKKSVAWSQKSGIPDMKYQLLPRSTGMYFCLEQLRDTVDWVYDCTIGYEGTPPDGYAQDFFTLRSTFLQGRPPKSVSLYWRRFAVKDIPMESSEVFEKWIEQKWREKDKLLEQFYVTGRFPVDVAAKSEKGTSEGGYIKSRVTLRNPIEVLQPWIVVFTLFLLVYTSMKFWRHFEG